MIQCHEKEPELEREHLEARRSPLNGLVVPVPGRPTVGRADKCWRSDIRETGDNTSPNHRHSKRRTRMKDATMVPSVMPMSQHQVVLLSSSSHSPVSTNNQLTLQII